MCDMLGFKGSTHLLFEIWDAIDGDGSGKITYDELNSWMRGGSSDSGARRRAIHDLTFEGAADDDDDEQWDAQRLRKELSKVFRRGGVSAADAIREWDQSGDARVGKREFLRNLKAMLNDDALWYSKVRGAATEAFLLIDSGGDGELSIDELCKWLQGSPASESSAPRSARSSRSGSKRSQEGAPSTGGFAPDGLPMHIMRTPRAVPSAMGRHMRQLALRSDSEKRPASARANSSSFAASSVSASSRAARGIGIVVHDPLSNSEHLISPRSFARSSSCLTRAASTEVDRLKPEQLCTSIPAPRLSVAPGGKGPGPPRAPGAAQPPERNKFLRGARITAGRLPTASAPAAASAAVSQSTLLQLLGVSQPRALQPASCEATLATRGRRPASARQHTCGAASTRGLTQPMPTSSTARASTQAKHSHLIHNLCHELAEEDRWLRKQVEELKQYKCPEVWLGCGR